MANNRSHHTPTRATRAAGAALAVTVALAAAKFGVWAATGSLAVLSQALDSTLDIVALGLVFVALRIASKPADDSHHFGHSKAEHLAAFTQTLLLGAGVALVAVEAIRRLTSGGAAVDAPWFAVVLLAGSALVDVARATYLTRVARSEGSDALRAGAINIAADVGTALVALVSLLAVRAGFVTADALGALIVGAAVALAAVRVGRRSVDVLMDRAPEELEAAIVAAAARAPGVSEARRVRVRGGRREVFADVVVAAGRTASLERAHDIAEGVEGAIRGAVPGIDVVVHVEPTAEMGGLVERVQAAASRTEGVHEIHNVLVHSIDEKGHRKLHATLHAKARAGLSLQDAHSLADRVEDAVRAELGRDVRVDAHIEPLETALAGEDVTMQESGLAASVRKIAEAEADVIDCHEVVVTRAAGRLDVVAHVRARADLPLDRIHDASHRIENTLHAHRPDVASILIHFEPA